MITKLVIRIGGEEISYSSDDYIISRQSSEMDDGACYVATKRDNSSDVTISENVSYLYLRIRNSPKGLCNSKLEIR